MARTKGALGKKNREAAQQTTATTNTTVTKTKATIKEDDVMKKNEVMMPINKELMVEGFNPDDYKQYYEDGTPYLPFKVQLTWFRMKYPNGKTPVFRPEWSLEKNFNEYVATARVYKDATDAVDNYLSEASAKRGPNTKIQGTEVEIDPYVDVQRAALSMALRFAGFWCSLTASDLSRDLLNTNTHDKNTQEPISSETEKPDESKELSTVEETDDVEKTVEELPKEPETNSEPSEEPVVESNEEAITETKEESATESNEESTTETKEESVTESNEEPVVESSEEPSANTESTDVETESETNTPVEENSDNTEPVEKTDDLSEETVESTADSEVDENIPRELTPEEETELAELRAMRFSNGYRDCTIEELENGRIENKESDDGNLFQWLLKSIVAERKFSKQKAAAIRIAELAHPDWMTE